MNKVRFFWVSWVCLASILTGCQLNTSSKPDTLPDEWVISPLTEEQIAAVMACDIEGLASQRYSDVGTTTDLQSVFPPESDCDWAALALAYANRLDYEQPLPKSVRDAFSQAVSNNYGFAFATPLFYRYFGSISMAEPPPFTQQDISDVQVQYVWSGYGETVEYTIEIHQADTTPTLTVIPDDFSSELNREVDPELIQALSAGLTNLLPVEDIFDLIVCVDNYPYWDVTLTFADDTTLSLTTTSNFLFFGGPWFTEIDGQDYMQYSADFAEALSNLVNGIGLPLGEPAGMSCFGGEVFELAFPKAPGSQP